MVDVQEEIRGTNIQFFCHIYACSSVTTGLPETVMDPCAVLWCMSSLLAWLSSSTYSIKIQYRV